MDMVMHHISGSSAIYTTTCAQSTRYARSRLCKRSVLLVSARRVFAEPPLKVSGDADRYDHREGNDDTIQPRALFNLFDEGQKARHFPNIAEALQGVPNDTIERQLGHFEKVHPDCAAGVRATMDKKSKAA